MDIICVNCFKRLFKYKNIKGLNQYLMLGLDHFEGIHMINITKKDDPALNNIKNGKLLKFWHTYIATLFPED